MSRSAAATAQAGRDKDNIEYSKSLFYDPESGKTDLYGWARSLSQVGGPDSLRGKGTKDTYSTVQRGRNLLNIMDNIAPQLPQGMRLDDLPDVFANARLSKDGQLQVSEVGLLDAMRSKNVDVLDKFFSDGVVQIGGELMTIESLTGMDGGKFAKLKPEEKQNFLQGLSDIAGE